MKLARGQRVQLRIDRLSVGGRGVGRVSARAQSAHVKSEDGDDSKRIVVFVSDTAPGEEVEVEITFTKKNFAEGRLLTVLEPSSSRIKPPCPVAGICGGCNWQHVAYPEQLQQKRELVRESLRKFSGFDVSGEDRVQPVIASPDEFRYRNRVQFHYEKSKLGFFQRGSHRIVNIDDCPITEESITRLIPEFKTQFATANAAPGRFEAYLAEDGKVRTRGPGISVGSKNGPRAESNQDDDEDEQGGLNFSFSQVNTKQNEILVRAVVEEFKKLAAKTQSKKFYDLYAGAGNFTFPILTALDDFAVEAVELNSQSVQRGQAKALETKRNVKWFESDVLKFLQNAKLTENALVLIDPPRTGCDPEVMTRLATSKISSLVYVSCHPVTLARDLKFLREAGFELRLVQPFDMFPQTDHVETLVVLERLAETMV